MRESISALGAGSSSMDKRLSWSLRELDAVPKNGFRVFSTFACAGGSTMGYKRAGFEVVGANDIDEEMAKVYRANHKPSSYFLGSIRDLVDRFRDEGIPEPLQGLDILDGSPPCTPFSFSSGLKRGKDWGKAKAFREGQAVQVLDDLFFVYLDLVGVLRPRAFIAENVVALSMGKAKGYAKEIVQKARKLGYDVRVLKLNSSAHGVPQRRERLFFVGRRDAKAIPLRLAKTQKAVTVREAWSGLRLDKSDRLCWLKNPSQSRSAWMESAPRGRPRNFRFAFPSGNQMFSHFRLCWDAPSPTVTSAMCLYHPVEPRRLHAKEIFRLGSFPDDFQVYGREQAGYVVGMSVPPFMIEDLSAAVAEQWFA